MPLICVVNLTTNTTTTTNLPRSPSSAAPDARSERWSFCFTFLVFFVPFFLFLWMRSILVKRALQSGHLFSRSDHFSIQPKQNWWSQPLIIASSFGSTSHIQIQQFTTAAGFLSASSSFPSHLQHAESAPGGAFFKSDPGGGFFCLLAFLRSLLRRSLCVDDGALRFLEGGGTGVVSACERFRDLVVGPAATVSLLWDRLPWGRRTEKELFVRTPCPVAAAKLLVRDC